MFSSEGNSYDFSMVEVSRCTGETVRQSNLNDGMIESSMMPSVLQGQPLIFICFLCLSRLLYTWYFLSCCYFEPKQQEIWHYNNSLAFFLLVSFYSFPPSPFPSSLPPFLLPSIPLSLPSFLSSCLPPSFPPLSLPAWVGYLQNHLPVGQFSNRTHRTQKRCYTPSQERMHIKINKGKRYRGQSPGETRPKLTVVFSQWSCRDSTNSPNNSDRCAKCCQPGKLTETWCPGNVLATSHLGMECPTDDLSYSASRICPSKGPTDSAWLRAPGKQKQLFTVNHSVSINCLAWSTVSGIQRHSYQVGYSKGSELISQGMVKGQSFLWNVQGLGTPSLLSKPFSAHSHTSTDSRSGKCKLMGK